MDEETKQSITPQEETNTKLDSTNTNINPNQTIAIQDNNQPKEDQLTVATNTEPNKVDSSPANKPGSSKKLIIIIVAVLLGLIIIGFAVFYVLSSGSSSSPNQSNNTPTSTTTTSSPSSSQIKDISFTGNLKEIQYVPILQDAWLQKQYPDTDLDKIKQDTHFYNIGTVDNNDLIIGDFGDIRIMFVKQGDTYIVLQKYSNFEQDNSSSNDVKAYGNNVQIDNSTTIPSLDIKDTITYNGVTVNKTSTSGSIILSKDEANNMTEVAKIEQGTVYEQVTPLDDSPGIKNMSILLKQPSGLYVVYRYTTDVLKDDGSMTMTLSNGSTSTKKYNWAMTHRGCSLVDIVSVLDKANIGDLKEISKSNNETVYGLKSSDNPVINSIYDKYSAHGSREGAVSKEQLWKDNGVVVVRNKLGYRVVLVSNDYQTQGECGKPVIYLYPQQKTDIKVEVGAKVTVSEPAYDTGWDVTAYPDGRIFNKKDSKTYPYLFWEGQGYGKYPRITEGFVVKRQDVEKTLRTHLSLLGLNSQESADFLEFWLPNMPNKPYLRLTWFDTRQMNELAPLKLSVHPDTTIRIFLDAQGLDKPIDIQPQKLTHPERKGFTLIEWGGLLYR